MQYGLLHRYRDADTFPNGLNEGNSHRYFQKEGKNLNGMTLGAWNPLRFGKKWLAGMGK